jgi:hypothetical protein
MFAFATPQFCVTMLLTCWDMVVSLAATPNNSAAWAFADALCSACTAADSTADESHTAT